MGCVAADWLERLEKLQEEIWLHVPPRRPGEYGYSTETRTLTEEELAFIEEVCASGEFVCEVQNACMGFGVALVIYQLPPTPGAPVQGLLSITNKHLSREARFEDGWEKFHPIVSAERNLELMKWAGLEPLRGRSYYDY